MGRPFPWSGAISAALLTAGIGPGLAAEPDAAVLEPIEVIGSRIKRADYETAEPVISISRVDLARLSQLTLKSADFRGSAPDVGAWNQRVA